MDTVPALTELASTIKLKYLEYQQSCNRADAVALDLSKLLNHAKSLVPHGTFMVWVETHCGFKIRQAQSLMATSNTHERHAHLESDRAAHAKHRLKTKEERKAQATTSAEAFRRDAKEQAEPVDMEADEAALRESDSQQEMADKLVEAGYRTLAKQMHPDVGGTHEAMTRLTKVRHTILSLIRGAL